MKRRCWELFTDEKRRKLLDSIVTVPSVELDGICYKSDRFYLHAIPGRGGDDKDEVDKSTNSRNSSSSGKECCSCGCHEAPPLFHRERLVQSLDLKAAILGTYTLDLQWASETFPQLIGPESTVPTLILHGHKGLKTELSSPESNIDKQEGRKASASASAFIPSSFTLPNTTAFDAENDPEDNTSYGTDLEVSSIITQEEEARIMNSPGWQLNSPPRPPLKKKESDPNLLCQSGSKMPRKDTTTTSSNKRLNPTLASTLGKDCYLSQVLPTCTEIRSKAVSHENKKPRGRLWKHGVHHPKFMLLFEKSGSLIVIVSTANLCAFENVEASWIQRFEPGCPNKNQNDFGPTLQDFLKQLSSATVPEHVKVHKFLVKYLGFRLKDLSTRFLFQKAKVHLIPTIPGEFQKDSTKYTNYGRERIRSILSKMKYVPKSKRDELLIQPTSLGGNWGPGELADVVKSYLEYHPDKNKDYYDVHQVLERMKIVWPSMEFVSKHSQSTLTELLQNSVQSKEDDELNIESNVAMLFLSSRAFNSCDSYCLARMAHYTNSQPLQRRKSLVPHFKSVARVCQKTDLPKADEIFSFFLLSSACLSYGAQGRVDNPYDPSSITYANFELGVLFTSQYRGEKADDRIYCFRPDTCCCNDDSLIPSTKLVHLPVPYSLKPNLYVDEEDGLMNDNPFFHDLIEGAGIQNMLMTPYGIEQAKTQNKKKKRKIKTPVPLKK